MSHSPLLCRSRLAGPVLCRLEYRVMSHTWVVRVSYGMPHVTFTASLSIKIGRAGTVPSRISSHKGDWVVSHIEWVLSHSRPKMAGPVLCRLEYRVTQVTGSCLILNESCLTLHFSGHQDWRRYRDAGAGWWTLFLFQVPFPHRAVPGDVKGSCNKSFVRKRNLK